MSSVGHGDGHVVADSLRAADLPRPPEAEVVVEDSSGGLVGGAQGESAPACCTSECLVDAQVDAGSNGVAAASPLLVSAGAGGRSTSDMPSVEELPRPPQQPWWRGELLSNPGVGVAGRIRELEAVFRLNASGIFTGLEPGVAQAWKAELRELKAGLRGDKARCAEVVDDDIVANTRGDTTVLDASNSSSGVASRRIDKHAKGGMKKGNKAKGQSVD